MILAIRNIFPNINVARFNVTAWQLPDSPNTILVGREVVAPGIPGEPDIGTLVLVELDPEGNTIHERVIWEPKYESLYLEDPRAFETTSGKIVIGLTALLRTKTDYEPFPALVFVDQKWKEELPPITLIQTFGSGKNLTPIGDNAYLFRPNAFEYHHQLLLFRLANGIPRKIKDIIFPTDIPWAKWRLGTTIPPLWLPSGEGILFIHGINHEADKYLYSIGVAKLTPQTDGGFTVKVHPDALITPDTFIDGDGYSLVTELRPSERRVVYACGGGVKRDQPGQIILYVNVGDKTTFEVMLDRLKLEAMVLAL